MLYFALNFIFYMKKIFLFCVFIFAFIAGFQAQNMQISGTIQDTTNFKPLREASVVVIRIRDSIIVDHTRSDIFGKFAFNNLEIDTFELLITHPKILDMSYYFLGSKENSSFDLGEIVVSENMKTTNEVVIFASREPVYYRGDTLVFQADSFQVKTNAVVEDLLKKLPGVEVDNSGEIKFQGKEVAKVLVDGDEFFGSDHLVATRNLDAKSVQNVEIYDKEIENAQDGSTETVQVMNLTLKDEAKKGYFGRVAGGTDFQRFYEGEALASRFNGKQKISGYVQGSNTPNSGFSWRDNQQYGFDNERQGILTDDGDWIWSGNSTREGLPQSFRAGFYYTDELSDKLAVSFNYGVKDNGLQANSQQSRQFFFDNDSTFTTIDDNKAFSRNFSHALNASVTYKIDSMTVLEIKPQFTFAKDIQRSNNSSRFLDANRDLFSETTMDSENESDELKFSNVTRLTRMFAKKNRKLELTYQIDYEDKKSLGFINNSSFDFIGDTLLNAFDQRKQGQMNGLGHLGRVVYWEPLSRFWRMEFEYQLNYFETTSGLESFDKDSIENYTLLQTQYSNKFENKQMVNMLGAFARYDKGKHMVRFGTRLRNNQTSNLNLFSNQRFTQDINNVLPGINYRFKPKPSLRINARYNTDAILPQISQLQPLLDNTNPNSFRTGNADLAPSYRHNLNVNFNSWNGLKSTYYYANASATFTNNDFSSSMRFLPGGITESQTINVDGNYSAGSYVGMGFELFENFQVTASTNLNYRNMKNIINDENNTTINTSIGFGSGFNYSVEDSTGVDKFDMGISWNSNYNSPKSTLALGSNLPYWQHTFDAYFGVQLPWKMRLQMDADYSLFTGRAEGFNTNVLICNAELEKRFLKKENLVLSLQANDIFNQNTRISRNIMTNMIVDSRTQIIARYFMLKLTYNFKNKIKTKEVDETFE